MALSALRDRVGGCRRMARRDRTVWRQARTIAELGRAGALWLEGGLRSQPAYPPRCGPDRETTELVSVLAAANRAGFYTNQSQPGRAEWGQTAAVAGFADTAVKDTLARLAEGSGLVFLAWPSGAPQAWRRMRRGRRPFYLLTPAEIEDFYGEDCQPAAVRALLDGWQVSLEDPEPGRGDRLWPLLRRFSAEHGRGEGERSA
jgi:Domain of unknown function (DUF6919)